MREIWFDPAVLGSGFYDIYIDVGNKLSAVIFDLKSFTHKVEFVFPDSVGSDRFSSGAKEKQGIKGTGYNAGTTLHTPVCPRDRNDMPVCYPLYNNFVDRPAHRPYSLCIFPHPE